MVAPPAVDRRGQQTREQREASQDPEKRLADTVKRLEQLADGGCEDNKRLKKRLFHKMAKLKAQLQIEGQLQVERPYGWTPEVKAKMRDGGVWSRVAPLDAPVNEERVRALLDQRREAKTARDYATADLHAMELQGMGVCYDDSTATWFTREKRKLQAGEAEDEKKTKEATKKVTKEATKKVTSKETTKKVTGAKEAKRAKKA